MIVMKKRLLARRGAGYWLSALLSASAVFGAVNAADSTTPVNGNAPGRLELINEAGTQWRIPAGTTELSVLAVGGGGGGAPGLGNAGGGGGGGGLVYVDGYLKNFNAKAGDTIQIKVGLPGPIVSMTLGRQGLPGEDTIFGKIRAIGGGGGGRGRNADPLHHASSGGSAGGGTMGNELPKALQPGESGIGIGFGHPGGATADIDGAGSGGGGAGGPGFPMGQGGGGIGLQGVPKDQYIDQTAGFVTKAFDANNPDHYQLLFRDVFGSGYGEDGWFAGGGTYNTSENEDQGGRGGGSTWDAMPHTGGGGGGSRHGYQGSDPGIGGSGVVLIRCRNVDGSVTVHGWGRVQPDELIGKALLKEPIFLLNLGQYDVALESLTKRMQGRELPTTVEVNALRVRGRIYAAMGKEEEALADFKEALKLETP